MDIQKEPLPPHAILSYSNHGIRIQEKNYQSLTFVSERSIEVTPEIISIKHLTHQHFESMDLEGIEVLIMGHQEAYADVAFEFRQWFSARQIGIEVMSLGAACRTFNILLSEGRGVLGVFLLG